MNAILHPARRMLRGLRDRVVPHGVILMYHRIGNGGCDPWQLDVSPQHFAEQIEVLRRRAEILPLDALLDALPHARRGRPPVAITFDDGYADNLNVAKPVLERFDAPATVFIASRWVGSGKEFWSDRLARLILTAPRLPDPLTLGIAGQPLSIATAGQARRVLLDRIWRAMRALGADAQAALLDGLERKLAGADVPDPARLPMQAEDVARLAEGGLIAIGAHSRSHCELTSRSDAGQMEEIAGSKADCEALTGRPVTSFAYPYGWYDQHSIAGVREAGFALACSTMPQPVTARADRYRLPRFAVQDIGGAEFERRFALRFWGFAS